VVLPFQYSYKDDVMGYQSFQKVDTERRRTMERILEELYRGNFSPADKMSKENSQYRKLMGKSAKIEEQLKKTLSSKEKRIFERLCQMQWEILDLEAMENFIYGFRMGIKLGMEIGTNQSNNFYMD
jgi:DNA-binding transcriptional regulator YbjK